MSDVQPLRLTGLKAHHPLGFLAACGVLRSCHEQGWRDTRLSWSDDNGAERIAVLCPAEAQSIDTLINLLIKQAKAAHSSKGLNWGDKIADRAKFRASAEGGLASASPATRAVADAFAALASDAVSPDEVVSTLFDLTSGNQGLLKSLRECASSLAADNGHKGSDSFREALVGPWRYADDAHSMGWDPTAQRLHALRNKVPAEDKRGRSVRAAVLLASQALPLFPCFASRNQPRTTGYHRHDGDDWFTWPVWRSPISLVALRSLLSHPLNRHLYDRGVVLVYRSCRARTGGSQGDYRVLTQPQEMNLSSHGAPGKSRRR